LGLHFCDKSPRKVVPVERIELPTFGLQNRCSTAELNRLTQSTASLSHNVEARIYGRDGTVYGGRLGRVNRRIPVKPLSGRGVATRLSDHPVRRGHRGGFGEPLRGGLAMASAYPPLRMPDCHRDQSAARYDDDPDLRSLRQENARLRELVVQLSSLVIKTIADQK
jgi:hypothetical protein